eukprot:6309168-Pyramimonas_sp.AAC.3
MPNGIRRALGRRRLIYYTHCGPRGSLPFQPTQIGSRGHQAVSTAVMSTGVRGAKCACASAPFTCAWYSCTCGHPAQICQEGVLGGGPERRTKA